jgi:hypothetical protein
LNKQVLDRSNIALDVAWIFIDIHYVTGAVIWWFISKSVHGLFDAG